MKPVFIVLNDQDLEIKFDFNSLVILEDMGISIEDLEKGTSFPLKMIRGMLYAGLTHLNQFTLTEVGSMIKPTDVQAIGEKIGEALSQAFGEQPKNDHPARKPKK
jgi:hypothetical protein